MEGVWERRKVEAGSPKWDAGRELRQAARRQASRERGLTMEPGTAIRSRKRASRGESRKVYASTFAAGRREVALDAKTTVRTKGPGQGRGGQSDTRGASRGQ
jgi:hypothetical protein